LDEPGISHIFDVIITSENSGPKSLLNPFREALQVLGSDPSDVAVIGNDELSDIEPAKELGIGTTIRVKSGWNKDEPTEADYEVPAFKDSLPIIESKL
jgi:FMN phosphatase YigB (HAD superfamily)